MDQRFAYDFLQLERGWSFRADGVRNEDFICFGQPIYAPASAVVVSTCDGVPDNIPGEMDAKNPLGNYVVLDHGNGEFSFLAHFQIGTVMVRPHAEVEAGDLVGRCGNSGNSSESHLHFHLQNTPEPFIGMGLPAFFCDYLLGGKRVPRGEPVGGQTISRLLPHGRQSFPL
ncbi:MAG TPA: M23 family metallopeptidase [Terriglobales bacterium]|nr:M23 family metallopeptidase [Terriglobales bacterium]